MKKILKIISAVAVCLILSGCEETPVGYYNTNYNGEAMRVADGIYFKKVYIQGIYALLQCDKDGNITHNQNVNTGYQQGKVFVSNAVLTPTSNTAEVDADGAKFNFKCSEITDCYNQVLIVKNSLAK